MDLLAPLGYLGLLLVPLETCLSELCSGLHSTPGLPSVREAIGKDLRAPAAAGRGGAWFGGAAGLPGAQAGSLVERTELLGVLLLLPLCDAVQLHEALVWRGRALELSVVGPCFLGGL